MASLLAIILFSKMLHPVEAKQVSARLDLVVGDIKRILGEKLVLILFIRTIIGIRVFQQRNRLRNTLGDL